MTDTILTGWRRLALGLLALLLTEAAWAGRVALVIGNSGYADRPLRNPANDATDLAAALERLGFRVLRHTDLDRRGMHRALQEFREALRGQELGLFYYAGHGAQYQGRNYLIPIRAEINDAADLPVEALVADHVLGQMQSAGNSISVVILDACRNLPYPGAERSGERGLARLDAIRGSLVAYATSPGSVTQDGTGRNSPYAAALLAELRKPGVSLTDLFNNVGWAVARATNHAQEPWYSASPLPQIHLVASGPGPSRPAPPSTSTTPPAPRPSAPATRQPFEPEMVRIPGGCFQMGSPVSEADRRDNERLHRVCVEAFEIGKYEVTQGEWQAVMGSNPSHFKNGDRYPVEQVSWNDVQEYLQRLNQQTGQTYRLPTEAEWEYACRGGVEGQRYCGGNDADRVAWHAQNSGQTQPVGRKAANGFGLYDLSGNIWEWTCSLYDKDYNGAELKCINKYTSGPRSLRGGSWGDPPAGVRSASRSRLSPPNRANCAGFRLARSL